MRMYYFCKKIFLQKNAEIKPSRFAKSRTFAIAEENVEENGKWNGNELGRKKMTFFYEISRHWPTGC